MFAFFVNVVSGGAQNMVLMVPMAHFPTRHLLDIGIYKDASRGRCDQQHNLAFECARQLILPGLSCAPNALKLASIL